MDVTVVLMVITASDVVSVLLHCLVQLIFMNTVIMLDGHLASGEIDRGFVYPGQPLKRSLIQRHAGSTP